MKISLQELKMIIYNIVLDQNKVSFKDLKDSISDETYEKLTCPDVPRSIVSFILWCRNTDKEIDFKQNIKNYFEVDDLIKQLKKQNDVPAEVIKYLDQNI